ncbi:MAG: ribonuclease HIII [Candidatus Electryonea clarkiae]|nr:ribonuclease HIII [Candidatus Electryonea clarkiae]MDP8285022.1 ribonuclease HIII [Candidatus Electryonea clarkiae]
MTINDRELMYVLDRLLDRLTDMDKVLLWDEVQHGIKLTYTYNDRKAEGVLYHSVKKKRFSFVPKPKGDSRLAGKLSETINELTGSVTVHSGDKNGLKFAGISDAEKKLTCWIGTDETGKGDLFGPLIAGGVICNRDILTDISKIGVRDSKELSPSAIKSIAEKLYEKYPGQISVITIGNKRYNEMYPDFVKEGGINGLLGWAHARVIKNLVGQDQSIEGAVIDKFAHERRIKKYLYDHDNLKLILRPRAESNPAVAAASILARYNLILAFDKIEKEIGFRAHFGSGKQAQDDLKRLFSQDPERLHEFVKMHFSPVKKLHQLSN